MKYTQQTWAEAGFEIYPADMGRSRLRLHEAGFYRPRSGEIIELVASVRPSVCPFVCMFVRALPAEPFDL